MIFTADTAEERLDAFLPRVLEGLTRSAAQRLIQENCVTVNGKVARASYDVKVGDRIAIRFGEKTLTVEVTAVQETVGKADAALLYKEV